MKTIKRISGIVVFAMAFLINVEIASADSYTKTDIPQMFIDTSVEDGEGGYVYQNIEKEEYVSAKIVVLDKQGGKYEDFEDLEGSVKLHGNSTSNAEKKPYKIKLSSKEELLGMGKGKKWTILANAFDKTLIRNKLGLELAKDMGLAYTSDSTFIDLYVNGEFMGNYLLIEPVEEGSTKVDIDTEANDFMLEIERERYEEDKTYIHTGKYKIRFAVDAPEEPSAEKIALINSVTTKMENALATHRMSEYDKYIDVDSFVDFYIVSELFKAVDFNYSSTRFYYKNGKMFAGPLWDIDLSSGNASPQFYRDYYNNGESYKGLFASQLKWYNELLKSDEFVDRLNKRYAQVLKYVDNLYMNNSLGKNQIDVIVDSISASIQRNYTTANGGSGWSMTYRYSVCDNPTGLEGIPKDTYEGNVEELRKWLKNRSSYLLNEWSTIAKRNKINSVSAVKRKYNSMTVSWTYSGDAEGFELYYRQAGEAFKLYGTYNANTKSAIVSSLKPGKNYYFKVRSFVKDSKGVKTFSGFKNSDKIKLTFAKLKLKTKVYKNKKAKLSWNKIKGAKGYKIYQCKIKKSKADKVKTKKYKLLKKIKKASTKSYKTKKLSSKYVYYFKVVPY